MPVPYRSAIWVVLGLSPLLVVLPGARAAGLRAAEALANPVPTATVAVRARPTIPALRRATAGPRSTAVVQPTAVPRPAVAIQPPGVAAMRLDAGETTFELSEAQLTGQLNAMLAGQSLGETPLGVATVGEIALVLHRDELTVRGTVRAAGVLLPIELKGTAVARSGRVLVEIGDAQVGGLYLPGPARRDVGQAIQDQVGRLLDRQQFTVRTVAIGEGKLTVVGAPAAAPGTPKGGAT